MNIGIKSVAGGREPTSSHHIDIDVADDVVFWTERFNVSMDELRDAVAHVGPDPARVDRYFEHGQKPSSQR